MGDWNAALDPKLDMGREDSVKSSNRSLTDLIGDFGLVDRYQVDYYGVEDVDVGS